MERTIIVLRAGIKRQKDSILGVFTLILFVSIALVTAVTVFMNSSRYIDREMTRLGYGDITVWVSGTEDIDQLAQDLEMLPDIDRADAQPLIYSGYTIGSQHSDNEGQLMPYTPDQYGYRFMSDDLSEFQNDPIINQGEIYISPSLCAGFDVAIGSEIRFNLSRDGVSKTFLVKGFFEDPFMGSSMIDMKSFLIGEEDYREVAEILAGISDFNILAREGAMFHIHQSEASALASAEFNAQINEYSGLSRFTEFTYTRSSIYGFMLILQNIFTGFLLAFALLLVFVSMVVMGHSIGNAIEQEYRDIGILKVIGFTSGKLRQVQVLQYGVGIACGVALGLLCAIPVVHVAARLTTTSTGVLMPTTLPYGECAFFLLGALCLLCLFVYLKTSRILFIKPIQAIQGSFLGHAVKSKTKTVIRPRCLSFSLALRQLSSGKKRYRSTCIIALLLVFFAAVVGRIDGWLGPNGEGLMNAFSVADHDIGAEPVGDMDMDAIEQLIATYSPVVDVYQLAMQNVTMNGVDYTANIIDEPERFHILQGSTCLSESQIVVTQFVAADMGIEIGDNVTVAIGSRNATYEVAGIYECANEMGANIGMNRNGYALIGNVDEHIWCYHYILESSAYNEEIMERLKSDYRVDLAVHTNSWSGLYYFKTITHR